MFLFTIQKKGDSASMDTQNEQQRYQTCTFQIETIQIHYGFPSCFTYNLYFSEIRHFLVCDFSKNSSIHYRNGNLLEFFHIFFLFVNLLLDHFSKSTVVPYLFTLVPLFQVSPPCCPVISVPRPFWECLTFLVSFVRFSLVSTSTFVTKESSLRSYEWTSNMEVYS